ncbi:hypothetical protein K503DRAFT_806448 [Rhizopogon vinicolor AM-OR11-026]|uniref:Uncharacterized protein n=1 Tax=Rhizopogon vinicolor AM-OR11-026 TaxID=1314800 RepID=A0A1B7MEI9_9AGAM|nr:hypothetical protein K503DRAFT_806448 [Rhizopogon vinicolor AM-OR11-026]
MLLGRGIERHARLAGDCLELLVLQRVLVEGVDPEGAALPSHPSYIADGQPTPHEAGDPFFRVVFPPSFEASHLYLSGCSVRGTLRNDRDARCRVHIDALSAPAPLVVSAGSTRPPFFVAGTSDFAIRPDLTKVWSHGRVSLSGGGKDSCTSAKYCKINQRLNFGGTGGPAVGRGYGLVVTMIPEGPTETPASVVLTLDVTWYLRSNL